MGNSICLCSQKLIATLEFKKTHWELSFFDFNDFTTAKHKLSILKNGQKSLIKKERYFDKECVCIYHGNQKLTYVKKTNAVCVDKI